MIESPRKRFQKGPAMKGAADLLSSDHFVGITDMVMLQFIADMQSTSDAQAMAFANAYKLQGAKDFLAKLLTFADMDVPMARAEERRIDYGRTAVKPPTK